MPIMPTYDAPTVETTAISMPQARAASPDTFGAGLGKAMETTGTTVESIIARATVQNNLETAQKFQAFAGQVNIETESQMKSVLGEAAVPSKDNPQGGLHPILDDYDKKISDWLLKNTGNGQQANYLTNKAQEYRNQVEGTMLSHELEQKKVVQEQAYTGAQSIVFNTLAVTAADPNRQEDYTKAYDEGFANADAYAIAHNLPEAKHQELLDDFEQKATTIKARQMMHINPVEAKNFIEENKDILGTEYTALKDSVQLVAADQQGINLAVSMAPRLHKESYTDLRAEGFKQFGGGTDKFDYKSFKVFVAQLGADDQAIKIARVQQVQNTAIPVQKLILQAEANGGKMDPRTLAASPEYKALVDVGTPEAIAAAGQLMDKTFSEHHAVVSEQRAVERDARAERRAARSEAKFDAAQRKQDARAGQESAYVDLATNPDKIASMTDYEFNNTVMALGPYGTKLISDRKALTSPEKLAQAKIDGKVFTGLMDDLAIPKANRASYFTAATNYIVAKQTGDKHVYSPTQMREAIIGGMQQVQTAAVTKDWFGGGTSPASPDTKLRMDVQNPASIIIPPEDLTKITRGIASSGLLDTQANRLRLYDALLADKGKATKKGKR